MTAPLLLALAGVLAGRHLAPASPPPRALTGTPPAPGRERDALQRVGRVVRRLANRAPDPAAERRVGGAVLVGVGLGALATPLAVVPLGWCLVSPVLRRRRERMQRARRIVVDLPDLVDLLALSAGAGLTIRLALEAVAPRLTGPLGSALADVVARLRAGQGVAESLDALGDRLGEPALPLVSALRASERYGVPLGPALERVSVDARFERRRAADELARRVPVKLLFPLVLCTLPAFALLTVVPLLAGSLHALRAS